MTILFRHLYFFITISLFTFLLSGCHDEALLNSLNQRQANEVLAVLQKHQIMVSKSAQGKGLYKINVAKEDLSAAVQLLQEYQLPSPERLEISQLFPADALVNSPQIEKARLISGIEQRLEQSLMALDIIADARVHLSYPIVVNSRSQTPMKASVIVFYHDEKQDIDEFKMGIKAFIKNAISELEPQYITVFLIHKISPPISSQPKKNTSGEGYYFYILLLFILIIGAGLIYWAIKRKKLAQSIIKSQQQ
ncbi:type III secretion system inner membrane ring lipoprotein SctJ [Candidatus Arsenophonus nilaparvatae]|uniref:type III secretion system inner membrane ring lipoprotein SctJ n=2 Tax=Arsenophonus TaxID=637 RepID=UPI00068E7E3F|nr:type III secretion inner membrane ring lipoprotein SctJ [Candidatus Arsenophonus nilaparvatae]